jgi:hypothetical protein
MNAPHLFLAFNHEAPVSPAIHQSIDRLPIRSLAPPHPTLLIIYYMHATFPTPRGSVVYEGKDQCGVDEGTPIPTSGLDSYTQTKALAEKLVLEGSGQGGMLTAAIRPHGIFGPGVRAPVLSPTSLNCATRYEPLACCLTTDTTPFLPQLL